MNKQYRTPASVIAGETPEERYQRLRACRLKEAERKRDRRIQKIAEKAAIKFAESKKTQAAYQQFLIAWSRWAEHYVPDREVTRKKIRRDSHSYYPEDTYELGTFPKSFERYS